MRSIAMLICLFVTAAITEAANTGILRQVLVMTETEDGKPLNDSFEVWDTLCNLKPSSVSAKPQCAITAVSITKFQGQSHVFTWRHDAESLVEVQPGIFHIQFNGRLSPCSGLDVTMRMDHSLLKIVDVKGIMRSGTQCQSVNVFTLDKSNAESRKIPPIWNPNYPPTP